MLKLSSILCPVDFSEFSAKAYAYALSLARHYDAKLFIQHVTEPALALYESYMSPEIIEDVYSRQLADVHEKMDTLVKSHPADEVKLETVVGLGVAADSILSFAAERAVDLIAMGTHGRRGLDHAMMGSTLERVLRKARCAVLAIHKPIRNFVNAEGADSPIQLRRILWCTDFSENSPRALEFALSLAFEYNAEITLLHVLEGNSDSDQERHAAELLERAIPDEARTWARAVALVLKGEPYQRIIEHADQAQTDLIVMGVRGRNIVNLAVFGSTTARVIQLGPCPVLTVKT